jgi:hypothetical protein
MKWRERQGNGLLYEFVGVGHELLFLRVLLASALTRLQSIMTYPIKFQGYGKCDEMDCLLIPDFVAADAHEAFGCSLNLQQFDGRGNKTGLPVMPA